MFKSSVKNITLLLFTLLTLTQCRTSRERQLKQEYKTIYIDQFKLTYSRKLLQAGFNNSEEINSLIKFDNSGFTEPVLSKEDYQLIESIVQADNLQMRADSIARIGRVSEGAEGKHVFSFLLHKLEGKWLDSLAKQRYKQSDFRHTHRL